MIHIPFPWARHQLSEITPTPRYEDQDLVAHVARASLFGRSRAALEWLLEEHDLFAPLAANLAARLPALADPKDDFARKLFPLVARRLKLHPTSASSSKFSPAPATVAAPAATPATAAAVHVTSLLLELDASELARLVDSPAALDASVGDALSLLRQAGWAQI